MTDTQFDRVEQLIQFIEARAVRGILPTDVNLDIWLSIIRLMLKGGAYIPHKLLQPPQLIERGQRDGARDQRLRPLGSHAQWGAMMNNLTSREFEILAMVARGNQNKNIATDLGLSQNTVKIHLHNIIRKLGVHNRTEAAAKYFEFNKHRYGTASQSNDQEVDHDASERNDDKHENRSAPSSD